ncbi:AAA family ATPase [Pyxidicoccus sp. 3LG]
MSPFATSLEHVLAELRRAEMFLRLQVEQVRQSLRGDQARTAQAPAPEAGAPEEGARSAASSELTPGNALLERTSAEILDRARESAAQGGLLRLDALAHCFDLNRFDVEVLLLAALPEVQSRVGELYAGIQGDARRRLPSAGLLLGLLCSSFEMRVIGRSRFAHDAPLLRHGLIHFVTEPSQPHLSLFERIVQVDERIIEYLHDSDALDARLRPYVQCVEPRLRLEELVLPEGLGERLLRFLGEGSERGEPAPILSLKGPAGAGKQVVAEALCQRLGVPLLVVDCAVLAASNELPPGTLVPLLSREALLQGAALYWKHADALGADEQPLWRAAFREMLETHPGLLFLSGRGAPEPRSAPCERAFLQVELARPGAPEQRRLWEAALSGARTAPSVDLELLTSTFRLTGGQVRDAAATARDMARFRAPTEGLITQEDLATACRTQSSPRLSALARRVSARASWEELVLPPSVKELLEELCLHVQHRGQVMGAWGFERRLTTGKGISALFTGPPGTGKTLAAGTVAATLGLELYQVDLSAVVSKYIGETEKHLGRLFDEAEGTSAILFFDEADALFGKRTEVQDAHDRNANLETSYLLQRIEAYDGLVILASNYTKNMDEAFVRRFRFILDFPVPQEEERRLIWERTFPTDVPRGADLDFGFLAGRFELAGAQIRNIALRAAFLAAAGREAVQLGHVLLSARREYQKMGKVMEPAYFSPPVAP